MTISTNDDSDFTAQEIGIAFLVTFLAGLCTAIGGAVVFFPKLANPKYLSASLSLASGAIFYLAMVDLFPESIEFFTTAATNNSASQSIGEVHDGHDDHDDHDHRRVLSGSGQDGEEGQFSLLWTTLCFFSGIVIMVLLAYLVELISPNGHSHDHDIPVIKNPELDEDMPEIEEKQPALSTAVSRMSTDGGLTNSSYDDTNKEAEDIEEANGDTGLVGSERICTNGAEKEGEEARADTDDIHNPSKNITHDEKQSLWVSGVSTAIALFLHNFPEGIITYITTVQDPAVGAALAIGIALHNIPEGMSVAIPLYYSDGKKWKAFFISMLTGLSQPIGALIAYLILMANGFSETTFGVMFGLAAGMLIYIAINNLLPTAFRYEEVSSSSTKESRSKVLKSVLVWFVVGMLLIAIALVVLDATGNHSHDVNSAGHGHGSSGAVAAMAADDGHDDHSHF